MLSGLSVFTFMISHFCIMLEKVFPIQGFLEITVFSHFNCLFLYYIINLYSTCFGIRNEAQIQLLFFPSG